jgi:hypothetical protein
MRIVSKQFIPAGMGDTRTMQTWGQRVGLKPHYLTPVVQKRPDLTLLWLTKGLGNVFSNGKDFNGVKGATSIDSLVFRWNIKSNLIPVIKIAEDCTSNGVNQSDIRLVVEKNYFFPQDTIRTKSGQLLLVITAPNRIGNDKWEYTCKLVTNDVNDRIVNLNVLRKGELVQWSSSYGYELDKRGYVRMNYNMEEHENHISAFRASASTAGNYSMFEDQFVEFPKRDKNGKVTGSEYFRLPKIEEQLQEEMLYKINQHMMFGQSNMKNNRALHQSDEGTDIIIGDGLIAQVERVCDKHSYTKLTSKVLREAIQTTVYRSGKITGNHLTMICNQRMWSDVQEVLSNEARGFNNVLNPYFVVTDKSQKSRQAPIPSKSIEGMKVGATYTTYEFGGNFVTFMPDYSLSQDIAYRDRAYGIFINTDLTDDGQPNIKMMTVKGGELITGELLGLGGRSGSASGIISTSVHGSEIHWKVFAGIQVADPYQAFILQQSTY